MSFAGFGYRAVSDEVTPAGKGLTGVTAEIADRDSLIMGDVGAYVWSLLSPTDNFDALPIAGDAADGRRSLVHCNFNQCAPFGGWRGVPFSCPMTVQAVVVEIDDVVLPADVLSSAPFTIVITDVHGAVTVHSQSFTPTDTLTTFSTSEVTLTPGREYQLRLVVHGSSGQANFLCGRVRVRPVQYTSTIWGNFFRLDVDSRVLQGNVERLIRVNPRYVYCSPFSFVKLIMSCERMVVQYYNTIKYRVPSTTDGAREEVNVWVDGHPLDPPMPSFPGYSFTELTLPLRGGDVSVMVTAGCQIITDLPAPVTENQGLFPVAIYIPGDAAVAVEPNPKPLVKLVGVGDSKFGGMWSKRAGRDSWLQQFRKEGFEVVSMGVGSDALGLRTSATPSQASTTNYIRKILSSGCDEILWEMGRNDFAAGVMTPANGVTQTHHAWTEAERQKPGLMIRWITWQHEVTENAVSGVSWDTQIENIRAGLASRPYVTEVPAREYYPQSWASNYVFGGGDTVHPNSYGQYLLTQGMLSTYLGGPFPFSPRHFGARLIAWYEGRSTMEGGAIETLTTSGVNPGGVTMTGTSVMAARVRAEVRIAGSIANGLGRVRVTTDNGKSFTDNITLVSATVLGSTGLTLNCPAGSYGNNFVAYADTHVSRWRNRASDNLHADQQVASNSPIFMPEATPGKSGILFVPNDILRVMTVSPAISAPYSFWCVAKLNSQTPARTFIGYSATGSGLMFYANTSTTVAVADGTNQIGGTCDATQLHCYICVVNGASSVVEVDGVTLTTGTLANVPLTGYCIGGMMGGSFFCDGVISSVGFVSGAMTPDERVCLRRRMQYEFGTP